eukprot:gene24137-9722_t
MESLASYQRALLHAAMVLLEPGGTLLYCTCTISPAEHEANVRYALDKWPDALRLEPCGLPSGFSAAPGLVGRDPDSGDAWMASASDAAKVARFDPSDNEGEDTMGFFIAKFAKTAEVGLAHSKVDPSWMTQ